MKKTKEKKKTKKKKKKKKREKKKKKKKKREIKKQKEKERELRIQKEIEKQREEERKDVGFCCEGCMRHFGIGKYSKYFPPTSYSVYSIVDGLRAIGENSSFNYRLIIAKKNGIDNYIGNPPQNIHMLNLLKQGKLLKP